MSSSGKKIFYFLLVLLLLSICGAWLQMQSGNEEGISFFVLTLNTFLTISKFAGIILLIWFIFYLPVIFLLRKWWRRKKQASAQKNPERAKIINKFIYNGNGMFGVITLFYALLLFVFGHLIAPDKTPYANDQINELSFKPPGFSIQVLDYPLSITPQKTNIFKWLVNGKPSAYKEIPITRYVVIKDSIYVSRYIGDNVPGQELRFSMSDITHKDLPPDQNLALIRSDYIHTKYFLFGTDDLGRDYLSRIIIGVRVSLSVGFVAVFIALLIGIPAGAFAGFYKKSPPSVRLSKKIAFKIPLDDMIMWVINVIWAIPALLLVFPIVFAFGQSFYTIFIAVGLTMWIDIARIVRGQVMQVRESEFVQAAKTFGYSDMRTIFRHILPNISGPVIVITAANFAYAILTEAGLSFLGIGVQPPAPGWGVMISKYKDNLITEPYLALIPGFSITLLVLAFFLLGSGLRDAFDVKTKIDH